MMILPPRQRLRVTDTGDVVEQIAEDETMSIKNSFLHFACPAIDRKERKRTQSCPPRVLRRSYCVSPTASKITTVMVRNIPTRFTSITFLGLLDEAGFAGTYTFFYLYVNS